METTRALLVLGETGQVARELADAAACFGFAARTVGRGEADLTAVDADALLVRHAPAAVINAAAYTAVDKAEGEGDAAFALNADMPARFAAACARRDMPFVHISTDYVFDGSKPSPYLETDARSPLGVYGASKAAGEEAVLGAGGRAAVMRTAWVYGAHGPNFVKTVMRLAQTRDELGVVDDQIGCPTWSADVAEGALRLAAALTEGRLPGGGIYHCAGAGQASWADLAEAVFALQAARGQPAARVRRITTAQFPTPAKRPANSRLDCAGLQAAVGWRPGPWRERLTTLFDGPERVSGSTG